MVARSSRQEGAGGQRRPDHKSRLGFESSRQLPNGKLWEVMGSNVSGKLWEVMVHRQHRRY